MKIQTHFTSKEVLDCPEATQDVFSSFDGITYEPTEAELGWRDFVKGKYYIADYLSERQEIDENGKIIFHIDQDFSKALDEDCKGAGKAVMLSDDTALQAIFFYNYREQD